MTAKYLIGGCVNEGNLPSSNSVNPLSHVVERLSETERLPCFVQSPSKSGNPLSHVVESLPETGKSVNFLMHFKKFGEAMGTRFSWKLRSSRIIENSTRFL